ncbi:MAG: bh protein [Eubacteriaceae bacterium]|nr:bh protein [Eubacteriaceae bacterium]
MAKNTMDAYLFCVNCDKETDHRVEYRNGQIHRVTCTECGMTVQMDQNYINDHYKDEFIKRVLTKPVRMTREMQKDLNGFLRSLPFRVITKPFRVYQEINELNHEHHEE